MKLMRTIVQELNKYMYLPYVMIGCCGTFILCTMGECYTDVSGRGYSAFQVLFMWSEERMNEAGLTIVSMLNAGCNSWFLLFAPLVLLLGYMLIRKEEQESGQYRFQRIRCGIVRESIAKACSVLVMCGTMAIVGYLLYGLWAIVKCRGIYDVQKLGVLLQLYGVDSVIEWFFVCAIGVFLYGSACGAFGLLVGLFVHDRYLLLGLPMLVMYLLSRLFQRYQMEVFLRGEEELPLLHAMNMDNLLLDSRGIQRVYGGGIVILLYVVAGIVHILNEKSHIKRGQ